MEISLFELPNGVLECDPFPTAILFLSENIEGKDPILSSHISNCFDSFSYILIVSVHMVWHGSVCVWIMKLPRAPWFLSPPFLSRFVSDMNADKLRLSVEYD